MGSAKIIIIDGPNPGMEFELKEGDTIVGRVAPADIAIAGNGVSGKHAKFIYSEGKVRIEDLGSTNGTFVNGQKIGETVTLRNGDGIGLGLSVKLSVVIEAPEEVDENKQTVPHRPVSQTVVEDNAPATKVSAHTPAPQPSSSEPTSVSNYAQTLIGQVELEGGPPELLVSIAGEASKQYTLNRVQYAIGRDEGNDIVLNSKIVSRKHARLEKSDDGGYNLVVDPGASNPVYLDGRPITGGVRLTHDSKIRIGSTDPGIMVSMTYLSPSEATRQVSTVDFGSKNIIQIGRDPGNDIALNTPQVSRYHAVIEKVGQRYRVKDLNSSNGTYVNGQTIEGDAWLKKDDVVRIGAYSFILGDDQLAQVDESSGLHVEAVGINKWVRSDLNILKNISLNIEPREFIVVVGQSGGGKSTLVDSIAGYRPASHGKVFVNGIDVYENFNAIRNEIGYVPQKDIIHMELTVFQALDYSAQLRMPPDTSEKERHQRVMEVMEDLDIAHRKDTQISQLSGGQQKRVSIGVELITQPGLFFLDEPSSGLDPGTETSLMNLMRNLADQGRTIILITHATKNVVLADKVVFLARGGYLTWFGPPDEALEYFNQYRSERDQRTRPMEFDEIYMVLDDPSKGSPEEWADRYYQHQAYQTYVNEPLSNRGFSLNGKATAPAGTGRTSSIGEGRARKQVSALRQFLILSSRNLKILTRDKFSLFLMLAAAPLVGLLDILLANLMGRDPFAWADGNVNAVIITLFLLTIYGVMVGGIAQMREIVKEGDIYKRERLVNLKILPYIMSKIWVAALLAMYQSLWYISIHYFAFDMPDGTPFLLMYISMTLATMGGMMLGLFASSIAPNSNAAPLIVIMLMLPQIVLGGALVPVPGFISGVTSTRWAFEGFLTITGVGSDIAKDSCYQLDPETFGKMSLDQRNASCNCAGMNALDQNSCDFPGIGAFSSANLYAAPPVEPAPLGDPPAEPVVPALPTEPADQSDQVAVAEYLTALQAYQVTVEGIQADYKAQLQEYQAAADLYALEYAAYQETLITQQIAVEGAVRPAEGALRSLTENFGWAWVDKDDPGEYWGRLFQTWLAQFLIMAVLFGGILFFQKRKDN